MNSKDKVKLNVYKRLLDEEKEKNSKMKMAALSLFVFGMLTSTSYEMIRTRRQNLKLQEVLALENEVKSANLSKLFETEVYKTDTNFVDDVFVSKYEF